MLTVSNKSLLGMIKIKWSEVNWLTDFSYDVIILLDFMISIIFAECPKLFV